MARALKPSGVREAVSGYFLPYNEWPDPAVTFYPTLDSANGLPWLLRDPESPFPTGSFIWLLKIPVLLHPSMPSVLPNFLGDKEIPNSRGVAQTRELNTTQVE